MKNLLKNETVKQVLRVLFKNVLPLMAAIWFVVGLVAMVVTVKAWSDFATGDFIFGMIFVVNIGFIIVALLLTNKMTTLRTKVRELENSVAELEGKINSQNPNSQPANSLPTNEYPTIQELYPDSYVEAEVKATEERDFYLPPDDDPFWPPSEQPENVK